MDLQIIKIASDNKNQKILKKYSSNTIKEQHVIKRIYNKIINMLHKDLNDEQVHELHNM